ncbi:MAG: phosphonate C-P lyase system protein PhnH [Aestuariivirga sp.]|nr:phosphonate C-P lyase system protein PhnH [Aestuariivirga sp.]
MSEQGFTDAAVEAAHAFRAIMQAMARPGMPVPLEVKLQAPHPLDPASAAVALTLCDFQTPLWLSPMMATEAVAHYLRFHTGAPLVEEREGAHFAFLSASEETPALSLFSQGTHEYPDRSATLVIQAATFNTRDVVLSGPGIKGTTGFGVAGLSQRFWSAMAENHAHFPIGIDVIFAAQGRIAALPRSTRVVLQETV